VQGRREPVGIALASLLPVGQDVEAGMLLHSNGEQRGIVLGRLEVFLIYTPELAYPRPGRGYAAELCAVDEPVRLRKAADDCGWKQGLRQRARPSSPRLICSSGPEVPSPNLSHCDGRGTIR